MNSPSFNAAEEFVKLKLAEEANKKFAPKKKGKNIAQKSSLTTAKEMVGNPIQDASVKIANKGKIDPKFTKTSAAQQDSTQIEGAMALYDKVRFGKLTSGVGEDEDRKQFREALQNKYPDGNINGRALDYMLRHTNAKINGAKPENGTIPLPDFKTSGGAQSITYQPLTEQEIQSQQGAVTDVPLTSVPGMILGEGLTRAAAMVAGGFTGAENPEDAYQQAKDSDVGHVTNFIGQAAGSLGKMFPAQIAEGIGSGHNLVSDMLVKPFTDPNAKPVDKVLAAAGITTMAVAAIFHVKGIVMPKSLEHVDRTTLNEAFGSIEKQYGQPVREAVQATFAEHPAEIKAFDTKGFTEGLKANEGPLEIGEPPKIRVRATSDAGEPNVQVPAENVHETLAVSDPIVESGQPPNRPTEGIPEDTTSANPPKGTQGEPPVSQPETIPPVEPPVQETPVEISPEARQGVAPANSVTAIVRQEIGLNGRAKPDVKPFEQSAQEAIDNNFHTPEGADQIVQRHSEGKNLSDSEQLGLAANIDRLGKEFVEANDAYVATMERGGDPVLAERVDNLREKLETYTTVLSQTGTDTARRLAVRQAFVNADGSFAGIMAKRQKAVGKRPLTTEDVVQAKADADELAKAKSETQAVKKELDDLRATIANGNLADLVDKYTVPRKFNKVAIEREHDALRAQLAAYKPKGRPKSRESGSFSLPDAELINLKRQLIVNRIKAGAATIEDLVIAVNNTWHSVFGEKLESQDIINTLALKGERKPLTAEQIRVRELTGQARRESTWAKAEKFLKDSKDIDEKAALKELRDAKKGAWSYMKDQQRAWQVGENIKNAEARKAYKEWWNVQADIMESKKRVQSPSAPVKKDLKPLTTEQIAMNAERDHWRTRAREAWSNSREGQIEAAQKRIDNLNETLKFANETGVKPGAKSKLPKDVDPVLFPYQVKEQRIRNDINARTSEAKAKAEWESLSLEERVIAGAFDTAKGLIMSADKSFSGNQGIAALFTDPGKWAKSWAQGFKGWTEKGYKNKMAEIMAMPEYDEMSAAGLFEQHHEMQDTFGGNKVSSVPIIKQSEQMFTAESMDLRSRMYSGWKAMAKAASEKKGKPWTLADAKALAKEVKTMTGQGQMGKNVPFGKMFSSVRLLATGFEQAMGAPLARAYIHGRKTGNFSVFKVVARKYTRGIGTMISSAAAFNLWQEKFGPKDGEGKPRNQVVLDVDSSDFGKLVHKSEKGGTMTVDVFPIGAKAFSLMAKTATMQTHGADGKVSKGLHPVAYAWGSYLMNRLHPLLSIPINQAAAQASKNKMSFGKKYDWENEPVESAFNTASLALPISGQNVAEAVHGEDSFDLIERVMAGVIGFLFNTGLRS